MLDLRRLGDLRIIGVDSHAGVERHEVARVARRFRPGAERFPAQARPRLVVSFRLRPWIAGRLQPWTAAKRETCNRILIAIAN
jgi:hypothetical protein